VGEVQARKFTGVWDSLPNPAGKEGKQPACHLQFNFISLNATRNSA